MDIIISKQARVGIVSQRISNIFNTLLEIKKNNVKIKNVKIKKLFKLQKKNINSKEIFLNK